MKSVVVSFSAGLLFAGGLGVSGMTQPGKVVGFLDVAGKWDPSLLWVMAGAVLIYGVLFRLIQSRPRPLFDVRFHIPTRKDIDPRLVSGAAIFGVGWGLGGFCPGPGIVSLGGGGQAALLFVGSMAVGMKLVQWVTRRRTRTQGLHHAQAGTLVAQ